MPKKPTGIIGPFTVNTIVDKIIYGQNKIIWPTNQKAIERKILDYFIREFEKTGEKFLDIVDGGTSGLDFLLTLPSGKAYLELMEAVVPAPEQNPFQPGQQIHRPVPYAQKVFEGVEKKTQKYGFKHETPINLLIYITHEQYDPNESALNALKIFFKTRNHPFQYVFFISPLAEDLSPLHLLFPADDNLPHLEELVDLWWVTLPSSNFEVLAFRQD